jgi:hypothetical protein
MSSKYDDYWRSQLTEIEKLIDGASVHYSPALDVSSIRRIGERESWYGKATVRGDQVDAPMAHLRSLGRLAASQCKRFPAATFVFTIDRAGNTLTVSFDEARVGHDQTARVQPPPAQARETLSERASPRAVSTRAPVSESVDAQQACRLIHALLDRLPIYTRPDEVPFRDGLYFFYEQGEFSAHATAGRLVRVGNHPRNAGRLVARLREHYSGEKNSSVFRLLLGGALIRRDDPSSPCLAPGPGQGHWERHMAKNV